jgi:hypothetical protein
MDRDKVPVTVTSIQILELNQDDQVLVQTNVIGAFSDGDNFTYTSITATDPNLNASSIPRGFQLSITGRNKIDENIVNTWLIVYNNDCGIFPILFEGEHIGWTVFVS